MPPKNATCHTTFCHSDGNTMLNYVNFYFPNSSSAIHIFILLLPTYSVFLVYVICPVLNLVVSFF